MRKILVISVFFLLLYGCRTEKLLTEGKSIGITRTNIEFVADYKNWTDTLCHKMDLKTGDIIEVTIRNEGGKSLSIKVAANSVVYEADNPKSSSFSFTIPEDGTYEFTIIGVNATGKVSFTVKKITRNNLVI